MRTALVVVDMVAFFVEQNEYCRGIVPNVNRMARTLRDAGGTVAWVLPAVTPPHPTAVEFFGPEIADVYARSGGEGRLLDRLWPQLEVDPGDVLTEKSASSAFFPGRSPLADLLAARDVETVIVAGTVTNVCCESTARDASTLGFRVVMLADGNAAPRDAEHNATLHTIYRSFGDVRPTHEVVALVEAGARAATGS